MAKAKIPGGTRVIRTDTGVRATYVNHRPSGGHCVLLDTGPKEATEWPPAAPVEVLPSTGRCNRCQGPHRTFDCHA